MSPGELQERRMEIVRIATLLSAYLDNLPEHAEPEIRAQVLAMVGPSQQTARSAVA